MASDDERQPLLLRRNSGETVVITAATQRKIACAAILLAEMFERVACFSLSGTFVYFLSKQPFCWSSWLATAAELTFTAVMYAVGLFAGWLSDSYLGRYHTLIVGYLVYIVGYLYLPIVTYYSQHSFMPNDSHIVRMEETPCNYTWKTSYKPFFCDPSIDGVSNCQLSMFIATIFIAIGAGVVRTNLAPFGGDQARDGGTLFTQNFFTAYYWFINAGCLLALLCVATIQARNFFTGYLVSFSFLFFSLVSFLAGTKLYTRRPAGAVNVFGNVFRLIKNAYQVKKSSPDLQETVHSFFDYANLENDGGHFNNNQIADVKQLWKISKVFLLMIPYWICYSQMIFSNFLLQGLHMRLDSDIMNPKCTKALPGDFHFPKGVVSSHCDNQTSNTSADGNHNNQFMFSPASLAALDNFFIILLLPLAQKIYRGLTRCKVKVATWRRLAFGMLLAIVSLLIAAILEFFRLSDIHTCGIFHQIIGNTMFEVSPRISMFWQIPQYCFVGASEVFFIVTGIEYAYMESPVNMQGIIMGLFWLSGGIGYFIGVALPYIFIAAGILNKTFLNCGRLDFYFYVLALFLFISLIFFIVFAKCTDLGLNGVIVSSRQTQTRVQADTPEPRRRAARTSVNSGSRSQLS